MDRTPDLALTARFGTDLARLWPQAIGRSEGADQAPSLGLAVSGGPDSLALLLLAHHALPGRIAVATVDHGLRAESAQEAAMVERLCRDLAVPCAVLRVTPGRGNVQDRARQARYRALGDWCEQRGLAALATAHHADDQAETLVMRLNRGSGLAGLAGVRARGCVPGRDLPLLRPLLGWRRTELAEVVAAAGIEAVRDPSNADDRFDRVRIRKALAETDWLDAGQIARSACHLGEAERYLAETIDRVWLARVSQESAAVRFTPGPSDFEAAEIARRIILMLGHAARRSEIVALVERLRRGDNASLGGVLARAVGDHWVFRPEPPRAV